MRYTRRRAKIAEWIIGTIITLILGGAAYAEISDDDDDRDDCGYSCQVESDDFEADDD